MFIDQRDSLLSSYDYELPSQLIAQEPIEPRHNARMMSITNIHGDLKINHLKVWDLLTLLKAGDLIVMNDTRVLRARLKVRLSNDSFCELFLLEPLGDGLWLCLGKPAKKMRRGELLSMEAVGQDPILLKVVSVDKNTGGRVVQFPPSFHNRNRMESLLEKYGEIPLPPYIKNHHLSDIDRYQTRYASNPGAVAAPTAGLHLSDELIDAFSRFNIQQARVTLHVGLGTFRPLDQENLRDLRLHKEWVEVKEDVVSAIKECHSRGGRVIAVGTTTVRSLEACFLLGKGCLRPFTGHVDLVVKPGHKFGVVDGLLTNFHLPKSSLLLLVSAFIGREQMIASYKKAIEEKYRFFSYGDAMFISPEGVLPSVRFS